MIKIKFIGAYGVQVSRQEYEIALSFTGDADLVREEQGSIALVEIAVESDEDAACLDLSTFHQDHTEYVPYSESYYDHDSLRRLLCLEPGVRRFRVAFFLHFYDPSAPLRTPYGDLACGPLTGRPEHLKGKEYVDWR